MGDAERFYADICMASSSPFSKNKNFTIQTHTHKPMYKYKYLLTSNYQSHRIACSFPFTIRSNASVISCCGSSHALKDETLVAEDNPRRNIMVDFFTLKNEYSIFFRSSKISRVFLFYFFFCPKREI